MNPFISVVVPVYKEEKSIEPFLQRMESVLESENLIYEIIFCMDPSPDKTYDVIIKNIERNPSIKLITLSRRFGQYPAMMSGILNCKGEVCVIIDVDLQDPPELIRQFIEKWREGYKVVYATRKSRKGETVIKKAVAYTGYWVIDKMTDINIPRNTGDYRLMDRVVIEELRKLNETHGFVKGLVPFIGFKQIGVEYDRDERLEGDGNYNKYIGDIRLQLNGIICFSSKPLQMMSAFGMIVAVIGFSLAMWYFLQKVVFNIDITPGLSTTTILITVFSGIQLFCMGFLGEYIGRIYDEVKRRPMFIIDEKIDNKQTE